VSAPNLGKLVLFLADGTTLDIPLDHPRVTVGRRPTNDVCLPYPAVSATHAAFLTAPPGVIVVEDLGSTNGTFVNGKSVGRSLLSDGDRIDIGRQQFVYVADASAVVPPQPRRRKTDFELDAASRHADAEAAAGATAAGVSRPVAASGEAPKPRAAPWDGAKRRSVSDVAQANMLDAPATAAEPVEEWTPTAPSPPPTGPVLRVISGPNEGRVLALTREESLIGRVGLQVVAVRKTEEGFRVSLAEGGAAPRVNANAVPADGLLLAVGDTIEVAGARIEYVVVEPAAS